MEDFLGQSQQILGAVRGQESAVDLAVHSGCIGGVFLVQQMKNDGLFATQDGIEMANMALAEQRKGKDFFVTWSSKLMGVCEEQEGADSYVGAEEIGKDFVDWDRVELFTKGSSA